MNEKLKIHLSKPSQTSTYTFKWDYDYPCKFYLTVDYIHDRQFYRDAEKEYILSGENPLSIIYDRDLTFGEARISDINDQLTYLEIGFAENNLFGGVDAMYSRSSWQEVLLQMPENTPLMDAHFWTREEKDFGEEKRTVRIIEDLNIKAPISFMRDKNAGIIQILINSGQEITWVKISEGLFLAIDKEECFAGFIVKLHGNALIYSGTEIPSQEKSPGFLSKFFGRFFSIIL